MNMKKIGNSIVSALCSLLLLTVVGACQEKIEDIANPYMKTAVITAVTETTASTGGYIDSEFALPISERGICWSVEANPTVDDNKVVSGSGTGEFTTELSGLKSGTVYFLRAYAITEEGAFYGDLRSFTTEGQLALTMPYSERFRANQFPPLYWNMIDFDGDDNNWYKYSSRFIGAISDSYNGDALEPYNFLISPKITIGGSRPVLEWNVGTTSINYPQERYKVIISEQKFTEGDPTETGVVVFDETMTSEAGRTLLSRKVDLSAYAGKDIYIAWVHYDTYDNDGLVITDIRIGSEEYPVAINRPTLGDIEVLEVGFSEASVTASIIDDGGVSITQYGFCYSTYPMPTIEDNQTVIAVSSSLTTLSANLAMELGTIYYVRAYAENAVGLVYSEETIITTPSIIEDVIYFETFSSEPFDRDWYEIDMDGDGYSWEFYSECMTSDSYRSSKALTPENYLVSPLIELPADTQNLQMFFEVASGANSVWEEQYRVLISETPITAENCREATILQDWTELTEENRGETFTSVNISLNDYKGKSVYISILHGNCTDIYYLMLRNFKVSDFRTQ